MKILLPLLVASILLAPAAQAEVVKAQPLGKIAKSADLEIQDAKVSYLADLDLLVFEQKVAGKVGGTLPTARGEMNGAPVLGYVFPTTLSPTDAGFSAAEGILALAVTSHPDFDDSPLWDENNDRRYDNDGLIFHTHWVVLVKDERAPGGLAVRQFKSDDKTVVLPPTATPMGLYMDSPGYSVVLRDGTLKVLVPAQRLNHKKDFRFDAVAAYMEVSTAPDKPMLAVYEVYSVLSKDLSLPYSVK
jgi:hypothetical protein